MTCCAGPTSQLLSTLVALTALAGCASTQQHARELAAQRWNRARAQVKAKLAADQFQAGNVSAAAGELAEAHRLDPGNPDLVPLRVRIWLAEDKLARAEELLEQTRLEGRSQAEIEYLLGVVRQQQQRWEEALEAFLRAVEIDDQEAAYVVAAAQAWLQLGKPEEALSFLAEMSPRVGWTNAYQATQAECYEQLGDWSAAAAAWQRVVQAQGDEAGIRERLAEALYLAGRHAEAIPLLRELLEESSQDGEHRHLAGRSCQDAPGALRLMLAECYLTEGRNAPARAQAQVVLQRERDSPRALRLLARGLAADGEYEAALRVARRALAVDGQAVCTLELAGALAWRAGHNELAASIAARLLELDAGSRVAQHILQQARGSIPPKTID